MPQTLNFQRLFESSPNAYALFDAELVLVAANPAYLREMRQDLDALLGKHIVDFFPLDPLDPTQTSARRLEASLARVLETGKPDVLAVLPYRRQEAGGTQSSLRYWSATHAPVPDTEGQLSFILQHAVDVTALQEQSVWAQGGLGAGVLRRAQKVEEENVLLVAEGLRLRSLFEQAPGFIAILRGRQHVVDLTNPAFRRLFGEREITGHSLQEAFPELEEQGSINVLDEAFRTGEARVGTSTPLRLRRLDDGSVEERFVDFVYQPFQDNAGQVTGIFIQGNDVTDRVRSAAAREQALQELRFMAESIPQLVWTATPDGQIDFVNRKFAEYAGAGGVLKEAWRQVTHPDDLERVAARWAWSVQTGEPYELEGRLVRHDGEVRWFLARAMPFRDEAGCIVRWFGTNTDIDDTRRATEELQARHQYEQQLVGIVSHDLKNPLAAILVSAQLLMRRGALNADQGIAVSRILSAARRATRLIADLLDFSRTRFAGQLPLEPVEVELPELVSEVVDEWLQASPEREIRARHEGLETGRWDRDRLAQAIGNLLSNALQHGRPDAPVTVSSRIDEREATIEVHNLGPTIPQETVPQLFEPFRQGEGAHETPRSVGLGLYIARAIMIAHGGRVDVRSSDEAGTTFTLHLPRATS